MIFISHSSKDGKVAGTLCTAIEARGHRCWIASRDVHPGQNFQDAIVEAIHSARLMILVFSQNANNSHEIKKEIALAGQQRLTVIPVRVEDVVPSGGFLYELATRQWIDLFDNWESAVETVVRRIDAVSAGPEHLDRIPGPPSPPVPRPRRPAGRVLLAGAALAALLAASPLAYRLLASRDALAAFAEAGPETAETRIQGFTTTVVIGTDRFVRTWARVKPTDWAESAESGARTYYSARRRIIVGDCAGTVVQGDEERTKLVFIPDRGCPGMPLKISYEEGRSWGTAGTMTDIR